LINVAEVKRIKFNKIRLSDLLGNGAYGVVMKAKWNSSLFSRKKDVAIKIIKSDNDIVVQKEVQIFNSKADYYIFCRCK
jgi:serine/threonine protein kinase